MPPLTALERFRLRVITLLEERGLTQKSLKGEYSEGWISNVIAGRRNLRLDDAEAIATALQHPLSELLRRPEDQLYELDPEEVRLIEAFRQLSPPEQDAFLLTITLRQRPAPFVTGQKVAKMAQGLRLRALRGTSETGPTAVPQPVQDILVHAEQAIAAYYARIQAPSAGADRPVVPRRPRHVRGPGA